MLVIMNLYTQIQSPYSLHLVKVKKTNAHIIPIKYFIESPNVKNSFLIFELFGSIPIFYSKLCLTFYNYNSNCVQKFTIVTLDKTLN